MRLDFLKWDLSEHKGPYERKADQFIRSGGTVVMEAEVGAK